MFWIAVFGSGQVSADDPSYQAAVELGAALAKAGWIVLNGGYGGIMEAVSKGAASAGGKVIGITTPWLRSRTPNAYLSQQKEAPTYLQRLEQLLLPADAAVVFPGGSGTFLEIIAIVTLHDRGFWRDRPILFFGNYWKTTLESLRSQGVLATLPPCLHFTNHIADAVEFLQTHLRRHPCPPSATA